MQPRRVEHSQAENPPRPPLETNLPDVSCSTEAAHDDNDDEDDLSLADDDEGDLSFAAESCKPREPDKRRGAKKAKKGSVCGPCSYR